MNIEKEKQPVEPEEQPLKEEELDEVNGESFFFHGHGNASIVG